MLLESLFSINMNKEIKVSYGEIGSAIDIKEGCAFAGRCKYCKDICRIEQPKLRETSHNHEVACHLF